MIIFGEIHSAFFQNKSSSFDDFFFFLNKRFLDVGVNIPMKWQSNKVTLSRSDYAVRAHTERRKRLMHVVSRHVHCEKKIKILKRE